MRLIALGLICLLVLSSRPVTTTAEPMTYVSSARFEASEADGTSTVVSVHVQRWSGAMVLTLSIRRLRPGCRQPPACGNEVIYSGSQSQPVRSASAWINQRLDWASVNTTVGFIDQISGRHEDVRIDIQWTANEALTPVPHGIGRAYQRGATVRGLLSSPTLGVMSLQSGHGGTIARSLI